MVVNGLGGPVAADGAPGNMPIDDGCPTDGASVKPL